jgi:preprotein translocase subunit SecG
MKHFFSFILCLLLLLGLHSEAVAQDMATGMRSDGKIYVVIFVLATIFAGIFVFLVYLERRIKKLESKK